MTLGLSIKLRRKGRGLTQEQCSLLSGIGQASWSQYESGKVKPSLDTLGKIAATLNCRSGELLGEHPPNERSE